MGLLNRYRSDESARREGVWLPFGDPQDPIEFKLAAFDHGFAETIQKLPHEDRKLARANRLPNARLLDLLQDALASEIILDWRNLQELKTDGEGRAVLGEDGKPETVDVPYSVAKAREILLDPAYDELHEWILAQAKDRENFREDFLREAAGN